MSKIIIENTWTVDNKNFADPLIITKSYLVSDYDGKKIPNSVVYSVDEFGGDNLNCFKTLKEARQYAKKLLIQGGYIMKITIAYWTKPNGKVSINSQRITEVITGDNAKDCMQQIEQKRENHDCWKYSAIEIVNVEDV